MNIGVLGTGIVGETIASALVEKGHRVMMGSRDAGNEKLRSWVTRTGEGALEGNFNDAACFGEFVFICLNGEYAIEALKTVASGNSKGKIFIDVTNPLDFSQGLPPQILAPYKNVSLGESIQSLLPVALVVKTLNTVNYKLMINAREVGDGHHSQFICGNDPESKSQVQQFLAQNFNWRPEYFVDLGTIKSALAMEAIVPFWVLVYRSAGTPLFNFRIVQ